MRHFLSWLRYTSIFLLAFFLLSLVSPQTTLGQMASQSSPPSELQPQPGSLTPAVSDPVIPFDPANLPESTQTDLLPGLITIDKPAPRRLPPSGELFSPLVPIEQELQSTSYASINELPSLERSFEGLNSTSVLPPDTNGAAGRDHYVQMVNHETFGARVGVFAKDSGNLLYEFGLDQLWPLGDACHTYALGDPIVLYDQLANRWLLSQFTNPPVPPYYECIAVSKTGVPADPNNLVDPHGWYAYSFPVSEQKFPDYPKISLWPNAYFMSANQFSDPFTINEAYAGVGVWAFERQAMLNGAPARQVYFDVNALNPNYFGLLPAGLLGSIPPPSGAPGYYASISQDWNGSGSEDVLHLFEFNINWNNPNEASFTWVKDLEVVPFDWSVGTGTPGVDYNWLSIPQPGTIRRLDDLADRLMMPLWYRNFGIYESLVVNHTIDVDYAPPSTYGQAGIRWYEVRGGEVNSTFADALLYQQGNIGQLDDNLNRWLGSLAMDQAGNIALGYSVSSNAIYPGIRYSGRTAGDPPGSMPQGEGTIQDGSGSQLSFSGRWGDYSAMTIDPVDDCTFWYTNEYIQSTAIRNWRTRVASFRFPNCSSSPDFILSLYPTEASVCSGGTTSYSLAAIGLNGFSTPINLSISGNPMGTTATFTPDPVNSGSTGDLSITVDQGQPGGQYLLEITGTSGALSHSASAYLGITTHPTAAADLVTPRNGSSNHLTEPAFAWLAVEDAATYRFELASDENFTQIIHQASGLSSTVYQMPFSLEIDTEYYWRVQAENPCGTGPHSQSYRFTTFSPIHYFIIILNQSPIPDLFKVHIPVIFSLETNDL